jgi:predicted transcriptional regulator
MITETLTKLGLSDKEAAMYLSVLQQGRTTPATVAMLTKINRTTVYSLVKDLVEKGFLTEDLGGKTTYLVATAPQDLKFLVQKEEKKLEQKKRQVDAAITELMGMAKGSKYAIPRITFIQEEDLENYLYKRSDEWHASIMKYDGILWGFQDHTFAEHYEKWIDWEWRVGGPKNLRLRLFSNKSEVEEKNKAKEFSNRRQIKYWKRPEEFTGTIWVHGDYLILVQTRARPHYLVEIYDALLADNMRKFLSGIWDEIK